MGTTSTSVMMLGITLVVLLCIVGTDATQTTQLTGPNVCRRSVWVVDYFVTNVTYPCYRRTCSQGWCRRSRTTCWSLEERCERRNIIQYRCCNGYEPNQQGGCQEVVECTMNNGGCDQSCRSDGGSGHKCECFDGYTINGTRNCVDVDECLDNNGGCNHQCNNLDGGFYCSCQNGFRLTSPLECTEIDECALENGGCEHLCVNTEGAFYCLCDEGYELSEGFACKGINELPDAAPSAGGGDEEAIGLTGVIAGVIIALAVILGLIIFGILFVRRRGWPPCLIFAGAGAGVEDPDEIFIAAKKKLNHEETIVVAEKNENKYEAPDANYKAKRKYTGLENGKIGQSNESYEPDDVYDDALPAEKDESKYYEGDSEHYYSNVQYEDGKPIGNITPYQRTAPYQNAYDLPYENEDLETGKSPEIYDNPYDDVAAVPTPAKGKALLPPIHKNKNNVADKKKTNITNPSYVLGANIHDQIIGGKNNLKPNNKNNNNKVDDSAKNGDSQNNINKMKAMFEQNLKMQKPK